MKGAPLILAAAMACSIPAAGVMAKQWLEPGPAVPPVSLIDQDGDHVQLDRLLAGRPVVISFFFTGCATVCPTETIQMDRIRSELQRRAAQRGTPQPPPLFLSISLDPLGDTPEAIRAYAGRFGISVGRKADWLMLTGSFEDLSPVWKAFDQPAGGPVDHDSLLWVGQPENGRWTRVSAFATPAAISDLVEDRQR